MVEVSISGAERLKHFAAQFKAAGEKGLAKEMGQALTRALDPVKKAIVEEAGQAVPAGYRNTLTRSIKHRRTVRESRREASVRLSTYATGQRERRDLPSINRGVLRHPVFGRYRETKLGVSRNPWATTRVRSGFHDRAGEKAGPEAERQLLKVVDDFAQTLRGSS